MLEKELETSLEQAEKMNRELRQRNARLATEVEQLRMRLDQQSTDCSMFQGKAQDLQQQHEHLLKYIRELEQKNDDLERAHRYLIFFHYEDNRKLMQLNKSVDIYNKTMIHLLQDK